MAAPVTCRLKSVYTWLCMGQLAHVVEHHKMAEALESDCLSSATCQLGDLKQVTYVLCYKIERRKWE